MRKHEAKILAEQAIQTALEQGLLDHWGDECLVYGAPGKYSEMCVIEALRTLTPGPECRTLYMEGRGILVRSSRAVVEEWADTRMHKEGARGLVFLYDDGDETAVVTSSWLPLRPHAGVPS